jgi:hypothetical protein
MKTFLPSTSTCSFANTHDIDACPLFNMDSPPGDTNMPKPASKVMPTRISRIPNLPSSRRPLSYTATSTGSPRANAITPPLHNTRSPAAGSKIPLPPSTSSHTPVPGATRPRSAFEASRSALPRAMGARETQTMRSSANLVRTEHQRVSKTLNMRRSTRTHISASV